MEQILSVREARSVANDYTVRWQGQRWAIPRVEVRPGLRGARVAVERRLDGSSWVRFRDGYLSLHPCPDGAGFGSKSFRPTASRTRCQTQEKNQIRPPSHSPLEEDTSTWQKRGHFYFALTIRTRNLTGTDAPITLRAHRRRCYHRSAVIGEGTQRAVRLHNEGRNSFTALVASA